MTNTAEGFERAHFGEKLQFYNIARASCGEVRSLSYVMLDASYISESEHKTLLDLVAHTGRLGFRPDSLHSRANQPPLTPSFHLPSP